MLMMICLSLAGCKTLQGDGLQTAIDAAADQAVAQSSIDIGRLPAECYSDTAHAPLTVGEELALILRRERGQLDAANAKRYRCASYHNDLRDGFLSRGGED